MSRVVLVYTEFIKNSHNLHQSHFLFKFPRLVHLSFHCPPHWSPWLIPFIYHFYWKICTVTVYSLLDKKYLSQLITLMIISLFNQLLFAYTLVSKQFPLHSWWEKFFNLGGFDSKLGPFLNWVTWKFGVPTLSLIEILISTSWFQLIPTEITHAQI